MGELYEYVGGGLVGLIALFVLLEGVVVPELDGDVEYAPTGSLIVSPSNR